MTTVDELTEIVRKLRDAEKMSRTVFCHPDLHDDLVTAVSVAGMSDRVTVLSSAGCPKDKLYVSAVDPDAWKSQFPTKVYP